MIFLKISKNKKTNNSINSIGKKLLLEYNK